MDQEVLHRIRIEVCVYKENGHIRGISAGNEFHFGHKLHWINYEIWFYTSMYTLRKKAQFLCQMMLGTWREPAGNQMRSIEMTDWQAQWRKVLSMRIMLNLSVQWTTLSLSEWRDDSKSVCAMADTKSVQMQGRDYVPMGEKKIMLESGGWVVTTETIDEQCFSSMLWSIPTRNK